MVQKLTVLICDDSPRFRSFVKSLLARVPWIEVAGEAVEGRHAVEKALELRPDVVLMDIEMPRLNGIEATRRIKKAGISSKVLILSLHQDIELVKYSQEAGADGYLPKECSVAHLSRAIEAVYNGQKYVVAA